MDLPSIPQSKEKYWCKFDRAYICKYSTMTRKYGETNSRTMGNKNTSIALVTWYKLASFKPHKFSRLKLPNVLQHETEIFNSLIYYFRVYLSEGSNKIPLENYRRWIRICIRSLRTYALGSEIRNLLHSSLIFLQPRSSNNSATFVFLAAFVWKYYYFVADFVSSYSDDLCECTRPVVINAIENGDRGGTRRTHTERESCRHKIQN